MAKLTQRSILPEPPRPPNRLSSAVKDDVNKVGLAAVAAAWMATGALAVPFVGLAAEAAYLLFVPESSWYRKRLQARHREAEMAYRRQLEQEVLAQADDETRRAYAAMVRARASIEESVPAGDENSRDMLRQLDYMLEKYLLYTHQILQYQRYLAHLYGDRGPAYGTQEVASRLMQQADAQLERLRAELQRARDDATRSVVEQNIDVLQKKRALIERVASLANNLSLHLQLFRNSFDLVGGLVQTKAPGELMPLISDAISKAELQSALGEQSAQIDEEIRQLRLDVMA